MKRCPEPPQAHQRSEVASVSLGRRGWCYGHRGWSRGDSPSYPTADDAVSAAFQAGFGRVEIYDRFGYVERTVKYQPPAQPTPGEPS